ncbi:N-acetylglucosaminyldiphosphoundecaprenol N-acetyl-beta-D-mannosaminyltransferase [Thermoflexales bacterium]|nr:N-acetylglucosaminyldiphosphoundecaprenol N-acetyl-beta-D-mannosaminyltransferase [Thermoflexales bacterium]
MTPPSTRSILGVPVHDVTTEETLALIEQFVRDGAPHQVCTVNPEFIMLAQHDADFKRILNQAALNLPDGIGVIWAARRLGQPLRERVAGSDLVRLIADRAQRTGWRIFLLGAAEGVAQQAAAILHQRYPQANIVGAYAGSPHVAEAADIAARIRSSNADVLLVAYGAPRQDKWIEHNLQPTGAAVAIGIGGSLDFIVGKQKRAPQWIQRLGLEWLYRLFREPWRWRRQLALPRFVWRVLSAKRDA